MGRFRCKSTLFLFWFRHLDDSVGGSYAQSSHFEGLEESIVNQFSENISTPIVVQANTNLVDRKKGTGFKNLFRTEAY